MPDYSNGKIYIVRSPHTEEVYIGSTVSTLSKRMGQHREKFNLWKKGEHHYFTCFKLIDLGDAYIELIEEYPCENKNQLERREGQIMRETVNCVNIQIAGQTKKEYRVDNKEIISEKAKEYRVDNKESILAKHKEYYEDNKKYFEEYYEANKEDILEKRKEYYQANKEVISEKRKEYYQANRDLSIQKAKNYYENNKDIISEKAKEYYENNIEKIKAHKSKLIVCECGAEITTSVKARHLKSKKHTDKLLILKD